MNESKKCFYKHRERESGREIAREAIREKGGMNIQTRVKAKERSSSNKKSDRERQVRDQRYSFKYLCIERG